MNRSKNYDAKLELIKQIRDNKSVLLGAYNEKLTKAVKNSVWKRLYENATELQLIDRCREFSYLRDTWWQNVKKCTMNKVDNAKKTGKPAIFTEIDDIVLEILDKDSSVVHVVDVSETWQDNGTLKTEVLDIEESTCVVPEQRKRSQDSISYGDQRKQLKLERLQLKNDLLAAKTLNLKLVNHNLQLQNTKLERELGLEEFTNM